MPDVKYPFVYPWPWTPILEETHKSYDVRFSITICRSDENDRTGKQRSLGIFFQFHNSSPSIMECMVLLLYLYGFFRIYAKNQALHGLSWMFPSFGSLANSSSVHAPSSCIT